MADLQPIRFDIAWTAVPKANRQRVARRGAKKHMIVRDFDGSLKKSEEEFADRVQKRLDNATLAKLPWKVPVKAVVTFCFRVPENWPAWKRRLALLEGEEGRWHHESTPDLDGVEKWLWDALEKVLYDNDRRIWKQTTEKRYWTEDRIRVTLYPCPQPRKKRRT